MGHGCTITIYNPNGLTILNGAFEGKKVLKVFPGTSCFYCEFGYQLIAVYKILWLTEINMKFFFFFAAKSKVSSISCCVTSSFHPIFPVMQLPTSRGEIHFCPYQQWLGILGRCNTDGHHKWLLQFCCHDVLSQVRTAPVHSSIDDNICCNMRAVSKFTRHMCWNGILNLYCA